MRYLSRLLAPISALTLAAGLVACHGAGTPPATLTADGHAIAGAPASDLSIAQALRTKDWAQARALAARSADPLAPDIVDWLRMQDPGAASASEIAAFLDGHVGWPSRGILAARLNQALATEPDPSVLRRLCTAERQAATTVGLGTLVNCATAQSTSTPGFVALLRATWVGGLGRTTDAQAFVVRWPGLVGPADDATRFDNLLARGNLAAATQIQARVDAPRRARLALRRDPATGIGPAQTLVGRGDAPAPLVRDLARALRRANRLDDAIALWSGPGAALADTASGTERGALARELLAAGRDADARRMAAPGALSSPPARAEALNLLGWICWRDHDLAAAQAAFRDLADTGSAPATQARAHYWLAVVANDPAQVDAELHAASMYPTTFYGQVAIARRLNGDAAPAFDPYTTAGLTSPAAMRFDAELARAIAALPRPAWSQTEALAFAALPFSRAAALLVSWEQPVAARGFLLRTALDTTDPTQRAMAAAQATSLGLPETGVAIARLVGRTGTILVDSGWPAPYRTPDDPTLPAGLALGLIRQESSFDALASSPAGARGLMQLLPGTASEVARRNPQAGVTAPVSVATLLESPSTNITLGQTYLAGLVTRFSGNLPAAIGAYNAGPHRMDLWLAASQPGPTPPPGANTMQATLDWIEAIPFDETRNYVEQVLANAAVYRARIGGRT